MGDSPVDHLVHAGAGARFDELGGPGLFGALGARLVAGTQIRLYARLPDDEPRFAKLFQELGFDTSATVREPHAMRLWILNSQQGRRIVTTSSTGPSNSKALTESADEADDVPVTGESTGSSTARHSSVRRSPNRSASASTHISCRCRPKAWTTSTGSVRRTPSSSRAGCSWA